MPAPRKLLLGAAATLGALLLLLLLVPFLLRDRIAARVQAEIAEAVDARVRWANADVGFFRDFPNVTLRLDDLAVTGVARFEGDTLVAMRRLRVVLDLGSVLRNLRRGDAIVVREVALERPVARLLVLEDGTANWDIVRERPAADPADSARALALSLRELAVREGDVRFDDRQSALAASLADLDLTLDGDFAEDAFALGTRVRAERVSLRLAGLPYLAGATVALDADVAADMRARRFTLANDTLRLNDLALAFAGTIGAHADGTALDLTFAAPSTDFADILSLVPALYARDFERLQTSGRMSVSGTVRGAYGARAFPALAVRARVEDGAFRYPELPLPARDIAFDLAVDNPGGHADSTVVTLDRFHLVLGERPVDARLVLRTPVSDPDVELRLRGSVDLADVRRTIPLDSLSELAGLVAADVALRTRQSWVDAGQYDRVSASGSMDATGVTLRGAALPHPVAMDSARLRFTPRRVELATLVARVGASDLRATGAVDNLLGFVLRDEGLRGDATVTSRLVDLNEWRSDEESSEVIPVPRNVDVALRVAADQVRFGTLTLANARGGVRVRDARATLEDFRMELLGGEVVASGFYDTTAPERPTFVLDLGVRGVDVPTAAAAVASVPRLAPIARYARGTVSAELDVAGALGADMAPVLDAITGRGIVESGGLAIEGFPALVRLADALRLEQLRRPSVGPLRAAFDMADGRVHVQPFDVRVGDVAMTVAGSSGVDQTIDYDLTLAVPTSLLGSGASQAITGLASRAGRAGIDLGDVAVVTVGVDVTGTVTDPVVRPAFHGTAGSVREGVQQAVREQVEQRVDSAAEAARRRARAEADRLIAEAEERAAVLRRDADSLAARVRREAGERAEALVARATNPATRIAAQAAADRLRREADARAEQIVREANEQADALVAEARRQADALVPPGG